MGFPCIFPYIFHLCPMFRGIFSHLFPSPTPPLVIPAQLPRLILSGDAFTHHRHGIKASEEDEITPQVAQPVLGPNFGGKMLKLWENPSKLHFFSGEGDMLGWGFQQCGVDDGLQQFAIDVTIDVGVRASVLWKGSWD